MRDVAVDHVEARLSFIQPQLVIGRLVDIGEVHRAPFDVEDTIRRSAGYRGEDTACPTRETGAAGVYIRALVVPIGEDRVVVVGPWQRARVNPEVICGYELHVTIGRHIDSRIGLIVQRVRERQRNCCYLIVPMVANVRGACHDAAAYLRYVVVVCRGTALHCVIPREGGVRIASYSSNRPGAYTRRHAASEIEVHREASSCVAVNELDLGDAAANIAGQSEIAGLN